MDFEALIEKRQQAIASQNAGKQDQAVQAYHELLDYEGHDDLFEGEVPDPLTLGQFFSVVHNNLGAIDLIAGRYKPARAAFRKALDLAPGNVEANTNLGLAHIYSGNPTGAIDCFVRALGADPGYLTARFSLAKALGMTGQHDEALRSLDASIAAYPTMAEFHAERAEALIRLSRLDEARKSAAEAMRLGPQNAEALAVMGTVHWMTGELELAAESYGGSLALRADEPGVHTNLAVVLQKLNRFDEAIESYNKALAIDPTFTDASGNLAYFYSSRGQIAKAREAAADGLKAKPGDPFLLFVLGRCDRLQGHLEAAKAQFLSLEPLLPEGRLLSEALLELAKTLDAMGEAGQAAKYLDRATRIGARLPVVVGRGIQAALDDS